MSEAKKTFKIKDIVFTAMGAALIAVCSWIAVPLPAVPITLQTFALFAVLGLLGGARGTAAVAVYLAVGACGAPVFSGFSGGVSSLVGATGGYLMGFLLSAAVYWAITAAFKDRAAARIAGMLAGLAVCYAFGTVWFARVYSGAEGPISAGAALMKCVVPFILPDLAKLALAFTVSSLLRKKIKV